MDKTETNLQSAFSSESQAYLRYTFFAAKADLEGFPEIARLFRAAAEAEMIHARNHFNVMGGIGSTKENVLAAATSEHYEITRVYPGFIDSALTERREQAKITFNYALKTEQNHNEFFEKTLEALKTGQNIASENYVVCQVCGNLGTQVPSKCPVCNSPSSNYKPAG